jgi:hypothetical protein
MANKHKRESGSVNKRKLNGTAKGETMEMLKASPFFYPLAQHALLVT